MNGSRNNLKKNFSWKWYLTVVIISEMVTILISLKMCFDYNKSTYHEMGYALSFAIMLLIIWVLNSLIIFVCSIVEFIKYKKYKSNGCNIAINVIIAILSSIMISIGIYDLNSSIENIIVDGYIGTVRGTLVYLGIGIALIFPVFKSKKQLLY